MLAWIRVAQRRQHFQNVIAIGRGPCQILLSDQGVLTKADSGQLPGQGRLQRPGHLLKLDEFGVQLDAEQFGLK